MRNAAEIVEALGGTVAVANALGIAPTTVSSWKKAGRIPPWRVPVIRQMAEKSSIALPDISPPIATATTFPTD
ncbi:carph-isopro domain-containing protein [Sphingobium yanoikuyae]|jgi:DNA-binding transcriptional regulator YdaS (Cro superfamily)|uniref:carph-isopro domain-containing protein n=1 Tax=Sphingobium yanoikuyae TaxID=13690 RepID=UPI0035C7E653